MSEPSIHTPSDGEISPEIETLVSLYGVNQDIVNLLKEGYQYLANIPTRPFEKSETGKIYVRTLRAQDPRIIDRYVGDKEIDLNNNLLRELAIILGSGNDKFIASDIEIQRFARLLLRIASDQECRNALKIIHGEYSKFLETRYSLEDIQKNPSINTKAKLLRLRYQSGLKLTDGDKRIIDTFNRSVKKSTHIGFSDYYFCWAVTVGILQRINFNKEQVVPQEAKGE